MHLSTTASGPGATEAAGEGLGVFGAERRQAILDLLRMRGALSISDLARAVDVSEVTVRRDVDTLEKRGLLIRAHGGAMLPEAPGVTGGLQLGVPAARRAVFGAERRRLIAQLVRANDAASLTDLAATLAVSEMTVRRDLEILQRRGVLHRERGGALTTETAAASTLAGLPQGLTAAAGDPGSTLDAIGEVAAGLAAEGGHIMLGGGRTVYALARRLQPQVPTTVLTTSVPVARALADVPNVTLVVAAGALEHRTQSLVGSAAERWVVRHRVGRAFVSGTGLTTRRGLSTTDLAASSISRAIIDSADETVVLADRAKLGIETTYQVAPVDDIDHVVVDTMAEELRRSFADLGVRVHQALNPSLSSA